jgi:tetratricopeptide (TPR) repeat protein
LGLASFERNRDYSSASVLWNDTASKNPANPRAHNNLGEALAQIPGRLPDAVAQFEAALRLRPDYEAAHFNLGVALLHSGRFEEALAHLKEADSARHQDNVHLYLGEALAGLHRHSEAAAEYSLHVRLEPSDGRAWYGLGNALIAQGRLPEAASAFATAVRIVPENPELAFALGDALAELKRYPEAAAAYRQGLARAPDRVEAHNNLGNVLVLSGQFGAAAAEFREASRLRPGDPGLQKSLQWAMEAQANGGAAPK